MYTNYYGFREKPFNIVPDPGYLYLSPKHRSALTYLQYGVRECTGFILLTGEVGTGKTTLVKHLLSQLETHIEVAVIFNTNVSADQLLEMVLREFEMEPNGQGKTRYLQSLNEFLIHKYGLGQRALLIVDEAQNLSREALEEIRMLSNLHSSKDLLLQIILVGQPGLRDKLKDPSLSQLRQRIAVSYHLNRLGRKELEAYVAHRLKVAGGGDREVFTPEALGALFRYGEGIPRKTNILCDAALVYGFADELKMIDADLIEQVIRDGEETGLFVVDAESEEAQAEAAQTAVPRRGDDGVADRIQKLEKEVMRLAALLDAKVQPGGPQWAPHEGSVIEKLTTMLEYERKRTDRLLAQYKVLRDRLHKQNSNGKRVTRQQNGAAHLSTSAHNPGRKEAKPGLIGAISRWLNPSRRT